MKKKAVPKRSSSKPAKKGSAKPRAQRASRPRNRGAAKAEQQSEPRRLDAASSVISIDDQDVILLETNNYIGMSGLEDIVFRAFATNASSRRDGAVWWAFGTCGRPHHSGKDSWIGLSRSIPLKIVESVQAEMVRCGLQVDREMGRALHLNMNPFARLSDDGLEILVPAALVGDPSAKRVVLRGGTNPVARGYQVRPSKAAALNELFLGRGE